MKMLLELIPAAIGTVAFAVLFGIPKKYFPHCAAIGSAGWFLYCIMTDLAGSTVFEATFLATALVVLLSRYAAVIEHCPATIFVTAGIFPLVPGAGIYWASYYLVTHQIRLSAENGFSALQVIMGIVLGIVVVFELPHSFFKLKKKT
ncbi:MAG: threonine/serine exporter family protein [Oscillospiraceae bacterium]|nr:threonine/serine exporter family protein [Oscillospiraceae bacterium]